MADGHFLCRPTRPALHNEKAPLLVYNEEIENILNDAAVKMLGYLASQYPTLNFEEKSLVKQRPIEAAIAFYNAVLAERNGDKFFPRSAENGKSDAFRHFVWAGLMTRDLDQPTTQKFLGAHELNPRQPLDEKTMDTFNNERGIQAAEQLLKSGSFKDDDFFNYAVKEIEEGRLKILNYEERQNKY